MKTSTDKFFDMLNEEFNAEQDLTDSQILEKRMEEGFKQIDQKISEAIENMQHINQDPPEDIPEDPMHENQENEILENNEGDEEDE